MVQRHRQKRRRQTWIASASHSPENMRSREVFARGSIFFTPNDAGVSRARSTNFAPLGELGDIMGLQTIRNYLFTF